VSAPRTVGGSEWAGLPDLGVHAVRARVDKAAAASALHADEIELTGGPDGPIVRFTVRPDPADAGRAGVTAEAPLLDLRDVLSDDGGVERRPVIRTRLELAGLRCPIELSLTTTGEPGYCMLVGRRALRRRFHVDPERSFVGGGTTITPPVDNRR
jgi:hypothetical protein